MITIPDLAYPVVVWAKAARMVISAETFAVQFRHRPSMHVEPQVGPCPWCQANVLDAVASVDVLKGVE